MTEPTVFAPQPGPQEEFLACDADIAVYGGGAYSGKSVGVLLWANMVAVTDRTSTIVFRRESPRLTGGGSIWEESQKIYAGTRAVSRLSPVHQWTYPNGSTIEFAHLQHEKDALAHLGKRYQCVVFEEATEFEETQFWTLWGRCASTSKVRRHFRLTCNPDPDSFVRAMIDWWIGEDGFPLRERSGVLRWFVRSPRGHLHWFDTNAEAREAYPEDTPISFTFIPALTADNRLGDPEYAATLRALPLVKRARMLGGNWTIREQAGTVLRREWFTVVDGPPSPVLRSVRGWDKAASVGGDWTRGAKWCALTDGYYLADVTSVRGTPSVVFDRMRSTAQQDGLTTRVAIWQDPGQAGVVDVEATRAELTGFAVDVHRAASSKIEYAQQWGVIAERGSNGDGPRVYVQRAEWNDSFFSEVDAFPGGRHDDHVDAVSCAHQSLRTQRTSSVFVPARQGARAGLH